MGGWARVGEVIRKEELRDEKRAYEERNHGEREEGDRGSIRSVKGRREERIVRR